MVRLTIDPVNNKILSRRVIYDKRCEFPVVKTKNTGKQYENCFVTYSNVSTEFSSKIANINLNSEISLEREFGKDLYVGESLHIPSHRDNSGYLINVVYNE